MITAQQILNEGGATIDHKGRLIKMVSGYQVSRQDIAIVAVDHFEQADVDDIVRGLTKRGEYAGFWVSEGLVYIDKSERIATKREALRVGAERKQQSVWNWSKQDLVWVA